MSTAESTTDVFSSPMEICWQFDYAIDIEKLRNLYRKAVKQQWDAETQLDWDIEIDPSRPIVEEERFGFNNIPFFQRLDEKRREAFTANMAAYRLSQFLHGEQGALMTAAALTHAVPDYEGKLYAATQTMDEARHVEVFERYVNKLGRVYPMAPGLKAIIDATLSADAWVKIAIGMNMVVEGLALSAFHNMRRQTTCDLLRSLVELVLRDESRHVAFGNVYVGNAIAKMNEDEREDTAQFAFETVRSMMGMTGGPQGRGPRLRDPAFVQALEDADIDAHDFALGMKEAFELGIKPDQQPDAIHAYKDLMMPALVRVGAVTARTRALFEEENIPVYEDARVLESMEVDATGEVDLG
jgi:hypothetical protein